MKVLLFGGAGQLGFDVISRAADLHFEIVSPVQSEVDITERQQVLFLARACRPDIILNCAAYTAVDKAEEDVDAAFMVNRDGARFAAEAAKEVGARLIYVSTDYVFDGSARSPIPETAATNPLSVYGKSKLEGEEVSLAIAGDSALVVRTSSLFGQRGVNFVLTMIKLFNEREELSVVNDQYMSPTWSGWLAEAILDLCRIRVSGVLHASCAGVTTWFDFARAIHAHVQPTLPHPVRIAPIKAADYPRAAMRPAYSAFDCSKLSSVLGRKPIPWQAGLESMLVEIGAISGVLSGDAQSQKEEHIG